MRPAFRTEVVRVVGTGHDLAMVLLRDEIPAQVFRRYGQVEGDQGAG
jgi:hypothetical protein